MLTPFVLAPTSLPIMDDGARRERRGEGGGGRGRANGSFSKGGELSNVESSYHFTNRLEVRGFADWISVFVYPLLEIFTYEFYGIAKL